MDTVVSSFLWPCKGQFSQSSKLSLGIVLILFTSHARLSLSICKCSSSLALIEPFLNRASLFVFVCAKLPKQEKESRFRQHKKSHAYRLSPSILTNLANHFSGGDKLGPQLHPPRARSLVFTIPLQPADIEQSWHSLKEQQHNKQPSWPSSGRTGGLCLYKL